MFNLFKKPKKYAQWLVSNRHHEKVTVKGLTVDGVEEPVCVVIGQDKGRHVVSYPTGGFGIFPDIHLESLDL